MGLVAWAVDFVTAAAQHFMKTDFTDGYRPNDQSGCRRTRIPTAKDESREEDRQLDSLGDFPFHGSPLQGRSANHFSGALVTSFFGHGIGVALDVYTKSSMKDRATAAKQLEDSVFTKAVRARKRSA